jgi:formylglycine-generating enzyme required for sulfatase activity
MKRQLLIAGMMVTLGAFHAIPVLAGDLTPPAAPGATMHTLEEIYQELQATWQQVAELEANQAAIEARLNADGKYVTSGSMVLMPAGEFTMGDAFDPEGGTDELPVHTVNVSAFYMDATEVTKARWDEVYTWATSQGYSFDNAGAGKATNHPVHTVNWYDCVKWANARSQFKGFTPCYTNADGSVYTNGAFSGGCNWSADGYRLPTEAEWEKAARGGAGGRRFPWEDDNTIRHARANYYASSSYSYDRSTGGYHPDYGSGGTPYTSPVGSFAPNGYGLYDMAGNLYEWCWDWYSSDSVNPPNFYSVSDGATDPRGPASGSRRVFRGGNWYNVAHFCRVAYRYDYSPGYENYSLGFRLVRAVQ